MTTFERTGRNQVRRVPERGHYDKDTIYRIVDEAIFCHVGLVQEGRPVVIPTLHARQGDNILLHGATKSRLIQHARAGHELCLTMTLLDGLVLARSIFHHSANYRSAVLFGRGSLVASDEEKLRALESFSEKILPGRWDDARRPNRKELKATSVVSVPIVLGSAKVRQGPPGDEEEDYALPVWAGVLPTRQQLGDPLADPRLSAGIQPPDYLLDYVERNQELPRRE